MNIDELPTPALLLDLDILEANLSRMQNRAQQFQVALRPHIKTHKCIELARRQQALGAKGITVSTFYEAEQFAAAGFTDITWAFPLPLVYTTRAVELANKITFRLVIDNFDSFNVLTKIAAHASRPVHVWLKVDCGYHRAGIDPASTLAEDISRALANSKALFFDGILTHAGHSYSAKSKEEIVRIAEQERSIVVDFAQWLRGNGITVPAISIGSTPTMTLTENLNGITEIRPGNYVFYDYTQVQLGVCSVSNCALTVLASIVSHQPGALHFITDAGSLALSKDPDRHIYTTIWEWALSMKITKGDVCLLISMYKSNRFLKNTEKLSSIKISILKDNLKSESVYEFSNIMLVSRLLTLTATMSYEATKSLTAGRF